MPILVFTALASARLGASGEQDKDKHRALADINVSGPFLEHRTRDPHDPNSADRCGEPEIAQDARHPDTLVMSCMSFAGLNYQSPAPSSYLSWVYQDPTKNPDWQQPCHTFISRDGGATWKTVDPAPTKSRLLTACADPLAQQGPRGELYLGGDAIHYPTDGVYGPAIPYPGTNVPREPLGISFTRSLDGGKTWSAPILIPTANDRPQWTVDQSTGVIYDVSGCGTYDATTRVGNYGCTPTSRNLAVSTNQGRTWTPSVPIRTTNAPTPELTPGHLHDISQYGAKDIAAAKGVFATVGSGACCEGEDEADFPSDPPARAAGAARKAHTAQAEPASVLFSYSTDNGATFTKKEIPLGDAKPCQTPSAQGVAGDPTSRGTFAVIVLCLPAARAVRVFVTHDLGTTWTEPADLAVVPPPDYQGNPSGFGVNRPWIAYGPSGALGVMWRQAYGTAAYPAEGTNFPGPQDVFVATSANGGKNFADPFRVNSAASPTFDPRQIFGDDLSHLVLDRSFAYVVWGDWRSGELQTWFRKVPIQGRSRGRT